MMNFIKTLKCRNTFLTILFAVIVFGLVFGTSKALADVINNFYGQSTINQSEVITGESLGAVTAVTGICNGSEPTTQMCNVNAYDFTSQSGVSAATLSVSGDATISGALTISGETQAKRVVAGGTVTEIATSGAETLSAAQICDSSVLAITLSKAASTFTLPASTTLAADCFTEVGKTQRLFISNASTVLASSTTFAAGAGITLASTTGVVLGGGQYGWLEITRIREVGKEFIATLIKVTD